MGIDITFILAIWGAFISSIALGWNFYRDISDKGKIIVTFYIGNIIGGSESSEKDFLI